MAGDEQRPAEPNALASSDVRRFVDECLMSWEKARSAGHMGRGNPMQDFGVYLLGALTNPVYGVGQAALKDIVDAVAMRRQSA